MVERNKVGRERVNRKDAPQQTRSPLLPLMSRKNVQLVWARKCKLVDDFSASVVHLCLLTVSHNVNIMYSEIITRVS